MVKREGAVVATGAAPAPTVQATLELASTQAKRNRGFNAGNHRRFHATAHDCAALHAMLQSKTAPDNIYKGFKPLLAAKAHQHCLYKTAVF